MPVFKVLSISKAYGGLRHVLLIAFTYSSIDSLGCVCDSNTAGMPPFLKTGSQSLFQKHWIMGKKTRPMVTVFLLRLSFCLLLPLFSTYDKLVIITFVLQMK